MYSYTTCKSCYEYELCEPCKQLFEQELELAELRAEMWQPKKDISSGEDVCLA